MKKSQAAFTLIELLIVFSIFAIMGALAVPAALDASRRASVSASVDGIQRVAQRAQGLARHALSPIDPTIAPHYGVGIFSVDSQLYATVIYGTSVNPAAEYTEDGAPVCRIALKQAQVLTENAANTKVGWFYQYGMGRPIRSPADQSPIGVGTPFQAAQEPVLASDGFQLVPPLAEVPASPVCQNVVVSRPHGYLAQAIAVYGNGSMSIAPISSAAASNLFCLNGQ